MTFLLLRWFDLVIVRVAEIGLVSECGSQIPWF